MRRRRKIISIAAAFIAFPGLAYASFEDGVDAFMRKDYRKAAQEWLPLAESGDADAARNLGRLYHEGLGVKQNYVTARSWYEIAAKKCNASAQNNLGLLLRNGQGGDSDVVRAFRMFQSAAMQGLHADADAMGNLAGMYLTGTGTQANIIEAYKWYLLHNQYTIDLDDRDLVRSFLPTIEAQLTPVQKAEAIRLATQFRPQRCKPT